MHKINTPSKQELEVLYKTNSISGIGRHYGVSQPTVRKWLKINNIQAKSQADAARQANAKKLGTRRINIEAQQKLSDKQWLIQQYVTGQNTAVAIGKMLGVSEQPVKRALKHYGIEKTDLRNRNSYASKIFKSRDMLFELYKENSIHQIASLIDSSPATVSRWLSFWEIDTRPSNSYPRNHIKVSAPTKKIVDHVSQFYKGIIEVNNRSILNGLELDIYFPEARIAIEYNGLYHHLYRPEEQTFSKRKDSSYHLYKTINCERQGIQLLQFFSDEYDTNSDLIHSMILSKLQCNTTIYARNCEVKEISTHEKAQFLTVNHIQGDDRSRYKYGLVNNGQLVSVMTFAKPRFSNEDYELMRFASRQNTNVVGGFSKLLKYFVKNVAINNTIVSYADRRFSNGNVYKQNGFDLIHTNRPQYYYVKNGTSVRLHRMHLQKKQLKQLVDIEGAESVLAEAAGYSRIYDCGTHKFVLNTQATV